MRILVPITLALVVGVLLTPILAVGFILLDANESNSLVSTVLTVAENLVQPFRGIFTPNQPELADAVAWGIAAAVYGSWPAPCTPSSSARTDRAPDRRPHGPSAFILPLARCS